MDGNVSFAVGTQTDGLVIRDPEEVPVAKILDHISPAELERFENQDFFEEDERERLLPPRKHPGRPRKGDTLLPSINIVPIGEEISRQSLLPGGSISIKRKSGRPKGSRNKIKGSKFTSIARQIEPLKGSHKRGPYQKRADKLTSTKPSVFSEPSTAIRKPRGRPPLQKNFAIVVPSFNGPQPQELESTPSAESESDDISGHPKPQYSMITASGLGQPDTEDATSRDQSVDLVTSSKKRRLVSSNVSIDLSVDDHDDENDERSPHPTKRAKSLPETSPDPIADDSAALLRQFQARVYGPDHSAKGSSEPSPTLDDSTALLRQFHAHAHPPSLGSSSPDSLMGPTRRPLKTSQTQSIPSKALPVQELCPSRPPSSENLATLSVSSNTISRLPPRQSAKATPTKTTSPSKSFQRKVSLTPHYPPSTSFNHNRSLNGSAETRPPPSNFPASTHAPSQATNTKFTQSSRIMPSPPKKRKLSPVPRIAPSQSSQASTTSKIGFAGLPPAKDITDYFAPKATVAKPAPIKPPNPPTLQILDPEDSGSEDQLAREPSTDSVSSDIVVVRQNRITPIYPAAAAEAISQKPSDDHDQIVFDNSKDGRSEDDSSSNNDSPDDHDNTTHIPHPTPPIQSSTSPTKSQSSAEALNKAFEMEDDEDTGSNSDSNSDSLSSEVMIIRAG